MGSVSKIEGDISGARVEELGTWEVVFAVWDVEKEAGGV